MERICKILLVLIVGFFISLSPITLSNLKADTVQDIKEITELYKEGLLTKEEFSKAKAKILGIEKQSEKEQNAKKKLKAKEEKKRIKEEARKAKLKAKEDERKAKIKAKSQTKKTSKTTKTINIPTKFSQHHVIYGQTFRIKTYIYIDVRISGLASPRGGRPEEKIKNN